MTPLTKEEQAMILKAWYTMWADPHVIAAGAAGPGAYAPHTPPDPPEERMIKLSPPDLVPLSTEEAVLALVEVGHFQSKSEMVDALRRRGIVFARDA